MDNAALGFYSYDSLIEWLEENVPADLVLCASKGVTVAMLIDRLDELANRAWSDGIDAMGEDA